MAQAAEAAAPEPPGATIRPIYAWWPVFALAILVAALIDEGTWFLNWVHVFFAVLWTGTDLFMGFVMGPVLRRVPPPARRAVVTLLVPRMLFFMPTLAIVTTTAGWYLAERTGFLAMPYPQYWWVVAALAISGILAVQGLGILLPINLKVYRLMRAARPDPERIARLMRIYFLVVASQGLMQLLIIVVMARFATGL